MTTRKGTRIGVVVAGVLVTLLSAPAAWAVVGTASISVVDASGNPVPGMTISLIPDDPGLPTREQRTDGTGTAVIPVEEGSYRVRVESRDTVTRTSRLTVRGGETTRSTISVTWIAPWMAYLGAGKLGGITVAPAYSGLWEHSLEATRSRDRVRFDSEEAISVNDPAGLNRDLDFEADINAALLQLHFGLATYTLWGVPIYVGGYLAGGVADVTLDVVGHGSVPGESFDGTGPAFGAGLGAVAVLSERFWAGAGFRYDGVWADVTRRPGLRDVRRDDPMVDYWAWGFYGRFGANFGPVSPWVGLALFWSEFTLETTVEGTTTRVNANQEDEDENNVPRPAPKPRRVDFTLDSEASFEPETEIYGMAGVDVHFGGPFFGSLETRFNGDGLAVLLKLMWAWGYVDP